MGAPSMFEQLLIDPGRYLPPASGMRGEGTVRSDAVTHRNELGGDSGLVAGMRPVAWQYTAH
jgi:hypothetical protein